MDHDERIQEVRTKDLSSGIAKLVMVHSMVDGSWISKEYFSLMAKCLLHLPNR